MASSDVPSIIPPDGIYYPEENRYVTGVGQPFRFIHSAEQCKGQFCVIHNPSDHCMRGFPTHLRIPGLFDIKQIHMERICPHGVGHPDPDDAAYQRSLGPNMSVDVHGCDGCCREVDDAA